VTSTQPLPPVRRLGSLVLDLVCVLALAVGGKSSHDAGESEWVVLAIVWPFALATAVAHGALISRDRPTHLLWPDGAMILAVTYALGMLLRALSGRGLAPGFLVVAAIFLTLTMLGWRVVMQIVARRRSASPS
jgi:hypothetical protein